MRLLLVTFSALLLAPLATLHGVDRCRPSKPNILVIVADDKC